MLADKIPLIHLTRMLFQEKSFPTSLLLTIRIRMLGGTESIRESTVLNDVRENPTAGVDRLATAKLLEDWKTFRLNADVGLGRRRGQRLHNNKKENG
jgi:hypothetical protein